MANAQQLANALISRAESERAYVTPPGLLVTFITLVVAYNDARQDAADRIPVGWVLEAIKSEATDRGIGGDYHHWSAAMIDRVCVEELDRFSFAHATDPNA